MNKSDEKKISDEKKEEKVKESEAKLDNKILIIMNLKILLGQTIFL